MSLLKDLSESEAWMKALLIGLVLVMPFWYFDLYLFHKTFFFKNPFHIPIVATFCLSICWHGINVVSGALSVGIVNEGKKKYFELAAGTVGSVFWIALLTYIGYRLSLDIKTSLRSFL